MKIKNKNKNKGFTFLEVMVTISVIAILSSIGLVSLTSSKSVTRLKNAQSEVAATIKMAQSYALQGKKPTSGTACGYGFQFTGSGTYRIYYNPLNTSLFSDCNAQNLDVGYRHNIVSSQEVEPLSLPAGVMLKSPAFAVTGIFFDVPHANAYSSSGANFGGFTLVFGLSGSGSDERTITVSSKASLTLN